MKDHEWEENKEIPKEKMGERYGDQLFVREWFGPLSEARSIAVN